MAGAMSSAAGGAGRPSLWEDVVVRARNQPRRAAAVAAGAAVTVTGGVALYAKSRDMKFAMTAPAGRAETAEHKQIRKDALKQVREARCLVGWTHL